MKRLILLLMLSASALGQSHPKQPKVDHVYYYSAPDGNVYLITVLAWKGSDPKIPLRLQIEQDACVRCGARLTGTQLPPEIAWEPARFWTVDDRPWSIPEGYHD